jgi:thiamine biosynthesis lipoprotein
VTGPAATATAAAIPRPGSQKESQRSWVEMVMGLPVSVTVRGPAARGPRADQVVHGVYAELHRADRVFSTYRTDSEVSLLRSGALARELASPDVQEVLDLCAQARELTGGSFDAEITQPDGQRLLDPSGLVKGNPNQVLCVLPLRSGAVATSSLSARGRHITDPRTGRPATTDRLLSATITGPSLTWADVLATAAFVQGPNSLARVAALDGYQALILLPDGRLLGSSQTASTCGDAVPAG